MRITDVRNCTEAYLEQKIKESFGDMIVMTSKQLEVLGVSQSRYTGEEPYQCLIKVSYPSDNAVRAVTVVEKGIELLCEKCGDPATHARFSRPVFWCDRCNNIKNISVEIRR